VVDDAQYYLAESHFKNEEYLIAASEYQKLVDDYPESPYVEEAYYKMGLSYMEISQRPALDQEYTLKALRQFQNFIEAYPNGDLQDEAQERIDQLRSKLAKKQLMGANVYRKMGINDAAVIYYDILLEKYYDTPWADDAMFYKGVCLMKMDKFEEALTTFSALEAKYPDSEFADKARARIETIQDKLVKLSDSNSQ
ncbi:MAG: outer membrane protein assembly factor BamD, partial [Calditrichia bacterium]